MSATPGAPASCRQVHHRGQNEIPARSQRSQRKLVSSARGSWLVSLARVLACCLAGHPAAHAFAATSESSDAEREARNIVHHLLAQRPAENYTNVGILKIRDANRQRTETQVELQTFVTETNWQSHYVTRGTNKNHAVSLIVIHTAGLPNQYQLANLSQPAGRTNECVTLRGSQAMIPFAGSDFWLADLGLEFLHWPGQRLLKKELKKSQSCYVIESTDPGASGGYARVVSWMDIDSVRDAGQAAIVLAEAYDAQGKLVKEFEPKELKKVNGHWQLTEMEIRNAKTGSRTRIEFNLERKP